MPIQPPRPRADAVSTRPEAPAPAERDPGANPRPALDEESARAVHLALARAWHTTRSAARCTQGVHDAIDNTAQLIVFCLLGGPERVSELAAQLRADVSTISRQVTGLTAMGLVTKQSDPRDGRVAQVALTDKGRSSVADALQDSTARMRQILHAWSPDDAARFAQYLDRFADDLEDHLSLTVDAVSAGAPTPARRRTHP